MFISFSKISLQKRLQNFAIVSAIIFLSVSVYAKPVLAIQHWQTANGARVYFFETSTVHMIQINVVFAAGSSRDGTKPGLAQLTNDMLNQGTKTLSADQIAAAFDDVGAQYNDSINRDMAIVSLQSLTDPKYLNPALKTFSDLLTAATFPENAFLRTQKQTLNAITQQQQLPDVVAKKSFYAAVYGEQGYAHPILGTIESVTALTPADLQKFYQTYYVAKNAIITIVGAIPKTQAEAIANQLTQNMPAGQAAAALPLARPLTQASQHHIKFPSEQTTILMGQVGINYNDPNYFPITVGNYLLGASPLTSILFNEVREKRGLAYGAGSMFSPMAAKGPFVIVLQTRNDQAQKALEVVQQTLQNFITQGITDAELETTKKKIINSFPLSLIGSDAISGNLINIGFYNLPLNYLDIYRDKVNAVTSAQIKAAFQQTLHPDKMVTIMVGNS